MKKERFSLVFEEILFFFCKVSDKLSDYKVFKELMIVFLGKSLEDNEYILTEAEEAIILHEYNLSKCEIVMRTVEDFLLYLIKKAKLANEIPDNINDEELKSILNVILMGGLISVRANRAIDLKKHFKQHLFLVWNSLQKGSL